MTENYTSLCERFYRERDCRTEDYLGGTSPALTPLSLHASDDACETQSGQLLLVTLVNQLARVHRELRLALSAPSAPLVIPALCGGSTVGDEIHRLTKRIDPYGTFEIAHPHIVPNSISIGIGGYCQSGLAWYLGCNRSNAELAVAPCGLGHGVSSDLRGAGLAALLGAAAAIKGALNIETVPTTVSAWNLRSGEGADPGPRDLPNIDVGRGLMVGAGAVASAVVYWLMQWGNSSSWTIVDHDTIKVHNTNRALLFFPDDAGWPDKEPRSKVACLNRYLGHATPVDAWYDEAVEMKEQTFDTVLVLANERDVRTRASFRNDPVQLQATTGRSWLSQLHRHIAGRDDCIRCRMADIRAPQFGCSEAAMATETQPDNADAALPFLSAGSGLMLASMLQRLQLGGFGEDKSNVWNWDFRSTRCIDSPPGYYECRDGCSTRLPLEARQIIAAETSWGAASWMAAE